MRFRRQIKGRKHDRLILRALFLLWPRPTSLTEDDARCVGEFRTTFRTIPAPVRLVRKSQTPVLTGWWLGFQ